MPEQNDLSHFNREIQVALPFAETIARLQEKIAAEEMLIIHEIPVQSILAAHGITIPATRQLLYFHPRYMVQILEKDKRAIIEAPLKFAVQATAPETTLVRFIKPTYLFGRYPELASLGQELDELVARIVATFTR